MNKFFSLLKVILKDDFSLFKINTEKTSNRNKILFPILLTILVFYSVGYYSYQLASSLAPLNLTYVMLSLWIVAISLMTIMECIYKSQGILYESKDNDLLMSLPINKKTLLFARIVKLILFQIMYNAIFMLPAMVVYAYFTHPGINFYLISLLMLVLMPIIPTVIASLFGAIVKNLTSLFQDKKKMQTIFSILFTVVLFAVIFYVQGSGETFINNASNINGVVESVYYPIKLYLRLINQFNILDLIKLIAINAIFLIVFVYIMSITYFKVVQRSHEDVKHAHKKFKMSINTPFVSLVKKEIKRYFSSPLYVFNTLFGIVILFIGTIVLLINPNLVLNYITQSGFTEDVGNINIGLIYLIVLIFILALTSITSSSISLEGKNFSFMKTMPVSIKNILLSKLVSSLIIIYPLVFISNIIISISFRLDFITILFIFIASILIPLVTGLLGLIINLKYPKLEYKNDSEVIKQSMSVMISVYSGMGIGFVIVFIGAYLMNMLNVLLVELLLSVIVLLIVVILYQILMTSGIKKFKSLNS